MNTKTILVVIALVLAIFSIFSFGYPLLALAVILLSAANLVA